MKLIGQAIPLVAEQYKALVVYNKGFELLGRGQSGLALFALNIAAWGEVEKLVKGGQQAYKALKYAPFPVVSAVWHGAGRGCEICLNADAVQAHAETYIGLVECGVGLIPGWGGCGEMLHRFATDPKLPKGPMPAVAKAFETISTATVAKSAANAREIGFLRAGDGITMNRDRLLADAKAKALALAENYTPPEPPTFRLPGAGGKTWTLRCRVSARAGWPRPMTRWCRASWPPSLPAARPIWPIPLPKPNCWRWKRSSS
jgi:3-hydroxyacyl-CoA dehydrogenase